MLINVGIFEFLLAYFAFNTNLLFFLFFFFLEYNINFLLFFIGSHNIGIAMATPHGLVVPNLKRVQSLSILEVNSIHSLLYYRMI